MFSYRPLDLDYICYCLWRWRKIIYGSLTLLCLSIVWPWGAVVHDPGAIFKAVKPYLIIKLGPRAHIAPNRYSKSINTVHHKLFSILENEEIKGFITLDKISRPVCTSMTYKRTSSGLLEDGQPWRGRPDIKDFAERTHGHQANLGLVFASLSLCLPRTLHPFNFLHVEQCVYTCYIGPAISIYHLRQYIGNIFLCTKINRELIEIRCHCCSNVHDCDEDDSLR